MKKTFKTLIGLSICINYSFAKLPTTLPEIPNYMLEIQTEEQVPDFNFLNFMYVPRLQSEKLYSNNENFIKKATEYIQKSDNDFWQYRHSFFELAMKELNLLENREKLENYFRVMMFKAPDNDYKEGCLLYFIHSGQILSKKNLNAVNKVLQNEKTPVSTLINCTTSMIFDPRICTRSERTFNEVYFSLQNAKRILSFKFNDYIENKKEEFYDYAINRAMINAIIGLSKNSTLSKDQKNSQIIQALNEVLKVQRYFLLHNPDNSIDIGEIIRLCNLKNEEYIDDFFINLLNSLDLINYENIKNKFSIISQNIVEFGITPLKYRTDNLFNDNVKYYVGDIALKFHKDLEMQLLLFSTGYIDENYSEKITPIVYKALLDDRYNTNYHFLQAAGKASWFTKDSIIVPALVYRLLKLDYEDAKKIGINNVIFDNFLIYLNKVADDKELNAFRQTPDSFDPDKIQDFVKKWWIINKNKYPVPEYDDVTEKILN